MDPLKSFEEKLLSGSLIDATKLKTTRPPWLDPSRTPRIYKDLEGLVTISSGGEVNVQVSLDTTKVYQVLLASGLPQQILASIWDQCSKSIPGSLVQHEFYQALALVAFSQAGNPPNVQLLTNLQSAPIPQLAIAGYPLPLEAVAQLPEASQKIPAVPGHCALSSSSSQEVTALQQLPPGSAASPPDAVRSSTTNGLATKKPQVSIQAGDEEDDFAEFQSAPSEALPDSLPRNYSFFSRVSATESSVGTEPFVHEPLSFQQSTTSFCSDQERCAAVSKQSGNHNTKREKPPSLKFAATDSSKQAALIAPYSLFDSMTLSVTETVQPPTENSPWLGFSLEPQGQALQEVAGKRASQDGVDSFLEGPTGVQPKPTSKVLLSNGTAPAEVADDDVDDFDDFQSAPVQNLSNEPESISDSDQDRNVQSEPAQDKYSVFRLLDESVEECPGAKLNEFELSTQMMDSYAGNGAGGNNQSCGSPRPVESAAAGETKVDILSMMKLPSIPKLSDELRDNLAQFDSLAPDSSNGKESSTSALLELQELNVGFMAAGGPVASRPSSVEVSPTKSVGSGLSVGESRGRENRLSIFTNKASYSECASLSSFELGPGTESNFSSPTKGSIVSLELSSRSPPEEDNDGEGEGEGDNTLEWTVEGGGNNTPPEPFEVVREPSEKQRRSSVEFCWAQPPMFPPPDPTDSERTSALLNSGLFLQNLPETQKKSVTRQQVAEGWQRILSKAAAILETASVILGNDPIVLGEILSTSKGQGYLTSLLEVYNVTQQVKKSANLHRVEGLDGQLRQVDDTWRGKLDALATRLHLSVVCMDHLSSPIRSTEDICAICSLPLNLKPTQILFGDNGYHSSCANFWANVLAEGLPCLKLAPLTP